MLRDELISLGVTDAELTEEGLVYASIPSTMPDGTGLSIGFVAHMDTSPDADGTDVKPWVFEKYPGGDVMLNKEQNILMREDDYPTLRKYVGEDLVFTDGTTLLGGDDKAAVASIMTMAEFFCRHPEIPHGPIKLCFTPDEEIARSTENFQRRAFWGRSCIYHGRRRPGRSGV